MWANLTGASRSEYLSVNVISLLSTSALNRPLASVETDGTSEKRFSFALNSSSSFPAAATVTANAKSNNPSPALNHSFFTVFLLSLSATCANPTQSLRSLFQ
jgi:hypothetical protein